MKEVLYFRRSFLFPVKDGETMLRSNHMQRIFISLFLSFFLFGGGCVTTIKENPIQASNNSVTGISEVLPASSDNITVNLPLAGDTVDNPIHVTGEARVFENVVSWRLRDVEGNILNSGTTEAAAPDMGQFGSFDFYAVVPAPMYPSDPPLLTEKNITLEVFWASAKDGSDTDLVSVPLELNRFDTVDIQVYFHNNQMDPAITCTAVFPVMRKIIATASPAKAAMIMLLQGPTNLETANQYSTIIPFRTWLKDISISADGVATVDFGGAIAGPMGGSCLVSSISAEIENTLKQFDSVKEVKILIDGEADRLQP